MQVSFYVVNAFSKQPFGGNPAAICPLDAWLPDQLMQQIAAQHNLSETAFFVPTSEGFDIRWFTPTIEVALCGHATLASAFVLFNQLGFSGEKILFDSKSGSLRVTRSKDLLTLDFPTQAGQSTAITSAMIDALNAQPQEAIAGEDLLLIFTNEDEIAALTPDFLQIKQLPYRGVVVTAPGDRVDFVCRFFAPAAGINEDPVTGSAYTKLIPYWSRRLGRTSLRARQISARGGDIVCELTGDRVLISGAATLYAKGEISLET